MKKIYLSMGFLIVSTLAISQPLANNLDIGLFVNGSHGSNPASGAYIELALRPVIQPYGAPPTFPTAEDFGIILVAPKTDFDGSESVIISQVNSTLYNTTATTAMSPQGVVDIGDQYWYFPIAMTNFGGLNLSSMTVGNWSFVFTVSFSIPKTAAQFNKVKLLDQTNSTAISTFFGVQVISSLSMLGANQLTAAAFSTLPVSLVNFSGFKSGSKNVLKWTTSSEQNNIGFEVQRSSDGVNYSAIGFVNSLALGGNSGSELSYTFDDNNPVASKKNFYRLNQKDIDGKSKMSNVVLISGGKPTTIGIGGIFPNPASSTVNVIIDAPRRDDVTVVLMDVLGKTIRQKVVNVEIGSNTVPVEIGSLASGSYLVKVLCKSDCETAVSKFIKQ